MYTSYWSWYFVWPQKPRLEAFLLIAPDGYLSNHPIYKGLMSTSPKENKPKPVQKSSFQPIKATIKPNMLMQVIRFPFPII